MALALFDLDNTLLSGDSDYEWGQFLVRKKLVDADAYEAANQKFYEQYKQGNLDIHEFCAFSFQFLTTRTLEELTELHDEFMETVIRPLMHEPAKRLLAQHREKGDTLIIITATNSFITRPIAQAFGVDSLIATEPRMKNNRYTTEIEGIPSFQQGKVKRLQHWLKQNDQSMTNSIFYSDSHNDLPLLELADTPVAVDPDAILHAIASERGWMIISLREHATEK